MPREDNKKSLRNKKDWIYFVILEGRFYATSFTNSYEFHTLRFANVFVHLSLIKMYLSCILENLPQNNVKRRSRQVKMFKIRSSKLAIGKQGVPRSSTRMGYQTQVLTVTY